MPTRNAEAVWKGTLQDGEGSMKVESGAFDVPFSFRTRFEAAEGTNPEELIGAAHAGCYSMALAHMLTEAGYAPEQVHTVAHVQIDQVEGGFKISFVSLETEAAVPEIDEATFQQTAEQAKTGCPVSQALAGTDIRLQARLKSA